MAIMWQGTGVDEAVVAAAERLYGLGLDAGKATLVKWADVRYLDYEETGDGEVLAVYEQVDELSPMVWRIPVKVSKMDSVYGLLLVALFLVVTWFGIIREL